MTLQEKASELIEQLKTVKFNLSLTDGYKGIITFSFKLSNVIPSDNIPYAEIESQEEYKLTVKYIISVIDNPNFSF